MFLALEVRGWNVGVVLRPLGAGEQRPEVEVVAVHVQLRHGRDHRVDLVLLTGEGGDQLPVVQSRRGGGQADLHERHRVRGEFHEGGVAVVDGVADALGEVDAVPQTLLPVVDVMDDLARTQVAALVHRGEVTDLQRLRRDALQLGGQFAQQWVHLRGVAGALGLELAGELALRLAAFDDRVDLSGRSADDGLGGGRVNAHLQIGEIREDVPDLVW